MEVDSIPQQAQEKIEKIDNADLVVGILADLDPERIAMLCEDLRTLAGSPRIVVLQNDKGSSPTSTPSEAAAKGTFPFLVPWPLLRPDPAGAPVEHVRRISIRLCRQRKARSSSLLHCGFQARERNAAVDLPTGAADASKQS